MSLKFGLFMYVSQSSNLEPISVSVLPPAFLPGVAIGSRGVSRGLRVVLSTEGGGLCGRSVEELSVMLRSMQSFPFSP